MNDFNTYIVDKPACEPGQTQEKNRQLTQTYISNELIPGCDLHVSMGWLHGMPEPARHIFEHVHEYDELVFHWGSDPAAPQVLGGTVEFYVGGQPITFNTTTAFFLPGGTSHGPVTWLDHMRPHIQMALRIGNGDREDDNDNGSRREQQGNPVKKADIDYERYIVRSPVRKPGSATQMVYMSNRQVPGSDLTVEADWITGKNTAIAIPETCDSKRVALFIGGDDEQPERLGADIGIRIGDTKKKLSTSSAVYIPQGTAFAVTDINNVMKPFIEVILTIGNGDIPL